MTYENTTLWVKYPFSDLPKLRQYVGYHFQLCTCSESVPMSIVAIFQSFQKKLGGWSFFPSACRRHLHIAKGTGRLSTN